MNTQYQQSFIEVNTKKHHSMKTVLIAEDQYSSYQYLLQLLDDANIKIIYATNGQQVLDLCKANPEVELILMDIKMPIMDGHTAAKIIKSIRPDIKIIAQTAYALESEKEQFIDIFDEYITKPISKSEFDRKLAKYLSK